MSIFETYIVAGTIAVFASYIITLVLVKGHLFTYPRCRFRMRTLWLIKGPPGDRLHPIDCRLCTGAWVSALVTLALVAWSGELFMAVSYAVVYGASYFLATQER